MSGGYARHAQTPLRAIVRAMLLVGVLLCGVALLVSVLVIAESRTPLESRPFQSVETGSVVRVEGRFAERAKLEQESALLVGLGAATAVLGLAFYGRVSLLALLGSVMAVGACGSVPHLLPQPTGGELKLKLYAPGLARYERADLERLFHPAAALHSLPDDTRLSRDQALFKRPDALVPVFTPDPLGAELLIRIEPAGFSKNSGVALGQYLAQHTLLTLQELRVLDYDGLRQQVLQTNGQRGAFRNEAQLCEWLARRAEWRASNPLPEAQIPDAVR